MTEPENLILVHLREIRAEQRELRAELSAVEERIAQRFEDRFDAIEKRLGKMQANGVKALQSFIGHRFAGRAHDNDEIGRLKQRVDILDAPRT
jgi:hypothetical protein